MRRLSLVFTALLLTTACSPSPADGPPDAGELPDAGAEPDAGVIPRRCERGEACSVLLDAAGLCAGACIVQPDAPRCTGRVVSGVCAAEPPPSNEGPGMVDGVSLAVVAKPERAVPGDALHFEIRLENKGSAGLTRQVELSTGPGFEIVSTAPATPGRFTLPAGGSLALGAELRATRPTIMVPSEWTALWITVGNDARVLSLPVGFASGEIACGDGTFPATWCDGESCGQTHRFYVSARCCDGVFYPGATCCSTSDCSEGACVDGRCVRQAPAMPLATTLLNAPQRVLLVLSDVDVPPGTGACTDLAPRLSDELHLGEVEAWFADELRTRAARPKTAFRWTIFGGLNAHDVAGEPPYYSRPFTSAAERWLKDHGCLESFDDFDKVIVASPNLEPAGGGVTAEAFAPGRIASRSWTQPLLFAHELSHTFGATDLYNDAAGFLQHRLDLMGDNLGALGPPRDGVQWGEVGLGDLDRNGVIDLAEFATNPEKLDFKALSATLTGKGTLEVTADVGAMEGGELRRVNLNSVWVEVPDDAARQELAGSPVAVFPPEQVNVERIRAAGAVKVRVTTEYRYTAADFSAKRVVLDETRTVEVTR